jgi:hypothetical protein
MVLVHLQVTCSFLDVGLEFLDVYLLFAVGAFGDVLDTVSVMQMEVPLVYLFGTKCMKFIDKLPIITDLCGIF